MISRRNLLSRAAMLAAAGGGMWLLRETVLWPPPRPVFEGDGSGWLALAEAPVPLVAATVNGEPTLALVDSGAQRSVIGAGLAGRLSLRRAFSVPMVAVGVGGAATLGHGVRADVALGRLSLPGMTAAVLDLAALGAARAGEVGLVLGQDLLRRTVLDLDLIERRLALRRRGAALPPTRPLPARGGLQGLYVEVVVEGATVRALVDTGASPVLSLSSRAADEAGLLDDRHPVRFNHSIAFGSAGLGKELTAASVGFGGRTFERPAVQIYPTSHGRLIPPALLGVAALEGARTLIDLGAGTMGRAA